MDTTLDRADFLALDLDFGRLIGKLIIIALCVMLGCLVAGLKHDEHRRVYRLSANLPRAGDILGPLLHVGAILCIFLWYESWVREWTKLLIAGFALGVAGGFAFILAFGAIYWLCDRLIDYPEPLPAAYRFAKDDLMLRPLLYQRLLWPSYLIASFGLEILERKVFSDIAVVRSALDLARPLLGLLAVAVSYTIGKAHREALVQREEEIKSREVTAAWSSPVALP